MWFSSRLNKIQSEIDHLRMKRRNHYFNMLYQIHIQKYCTQILRCRSEWTHVSKSKIFHLDEIMYMYAYLWCKIGSTWFFLGGRRPIDDRRRIY